MNTTTNTRGVSDDLLRYLRRVVEFNEGICTTNEAAQKALGFIGMHGRELLAALSAPEPAAQGEAVNVPGYDVGWKIRGVTAYNEAKRKGYRHPECVEAAIKAAPPAQPAERVPEGPVLDADARIGCTVFRKGVRWSTVIERAQREFKYFEAHPTGINAQIITASPAPSEGGKGVDRG